MSYHDDSRSFSSAHTTAIGPLTKRYSDAEIEAFEKQQAQRKETRSLAEIRDDIRENGDF